MAGPEEGWLLAPRSSTPGLALGTVGGSGSRSSGSSPAIDSCHQEDVTAPSSLSETGASAPWLSCLSMLCQARAPALLARHGLGTQHHRPGRGHLPGQGDISQGILHAGTSSFSPLRSTTSLLQSPLPASCALPARFPPPQGIAAAVPPFCSIPSFAPLPWHSLFSLWPSTGATGTGFFLLGPWWYWERGCCTPGWE